MQKYLVTGGAGFIVSHITERLRSEGNFVRVLDNLSSGKLKNLSFTQDAQRNSQYEFLKGDIRDFSTCQKVCEDIDVVFHQAALRSVPKSLDDPYAFNEVNINGTLNMLEAAKQKRVKSFIFASSSSVYGETERFPEKETDLPRLISPYALTKLAGEYYCRVYSENYDLPTVCLRYFNVFGQRQALDDEYAVVIPKFIDCILKGESPPVFGKGKQSRDFTYIDNVGEANLLAASRPDLKCTVLNIDDGRNKTILELVRLLNSIIRKEIQPVFLPPRPGDIFQTLADISQAKRTLNYKPKINFQEGLTKTVEWFRNNLRGIK